jgi:aspartyl/asparaginyl beta-hydroxylase (cupin superfamily)
MESIWSKVIAINISKYINRGYNHLRTYSYLSIQWEGWIRTKCKWYNVQGKIA